MLLNGRCVIRRNEQGQRDFRDAYNGMLTVKEVKELCDSLINSGMGHYGIVFGDDHGKYHHVGLGASWTERGDKDNEAFVEEHVVIPKWWKEDGNIYIDCDELVFVD